MGKLIIRNLGKQFRLGEFGTGSLGHDLNKFYHRVLGKEDPYLSVHQTENPNSSKGYSWALKNVSFDVESGDVVGIIGKNGAGKSTLLKILSKVYKPTSGTVYAEGRIASLLEVGTGFHPEMTGKENIYLNGTILGMTKLEIDSKFEDIVDFAGVSKYLDTPVKRYSSGMKVRLGFAVAAFLEPEILIVDEVLAVGDFEFQQKALSKIDSVSKSSNRTVLFVSHNMNSIRQICNKAVILENGEMVYYGQVEDAIAQYEGNELKKATIGKINLTSSKRSIFIPSPAAVFLSAEIIEMSKMFSGDTMKFLFTVNVDVDNDIYEIRCLFKDIFGKRIGFAHSNNLRLSKGISHVQVLVSDVRLVPGKYSIDLNLTTGTIIDGYKDQDVINDVLSFEIHGYSKKFPNARGIQKQWGNVLFNNVETDVLP